MTLCESKTVPELKAMCKETGSKGFSGMKKPELVKKCCEPLSRFELKEEDDLYCDLVKKAGSPGHLALDCQVERKGGSTYKLPFQVDKIKARHNIAASIIELRRSTGDVGFNWESYHFTDPWNSKFYDDSRSTPGYIHSHPDWSAWHELDVQKRFESIWDKEGYSDNNIHLVKNWSDGKSHTYVKQTKIRAYAQPDELGFDKTGLCEFEKDGSATVLECQSA